MSIEKIICHQQHKNNIHVSFACEYKTLPSVTNILGDFSMLRFSIVLLAAQVLSQVTQAHCVRHVGIKI